MAVDGPTYKSLKKFAQEQSGEDTKYCYKTTDTISTTLNNTDYVPLFYVSNNTTLRKNVQWSTFITNIKNNVSATDIGAIPSTEKGANGGVATLDSSGKVPSSQLPSYVDDVLEYANKASFPSTGESGKIYVALDTNLTYRWSGSAYVEISPSLALGETSSTAYRGDRGKTAYDHSQLTSGNPHNVTKTDVGLGNVGNFKAVSTVASQGLTDTEKSNARANIGAGTSSLTLGTTATTAAKGNHTHNVSIASDSGTSALDLVASTVYKLTAGGSTFIFKTPTDTNTTYSMTRDGTSVKLTPSSGTAQSVSLDSLLSNLPNWTATPTDDTYLVRRDTGGGASYGQVKFSTVWNYISGKVGIASSGNTFLRKDGTWATPTDTNNRRGFWGTSSTAAATAEKAVTLGSTAGWELVAGTIVGVKFTNSNTAGTVKLNVNSSGAKQIWYNGAAYTGTEVRITGWAGHTIYYIYDGTYWEFINNDANYINTNTTYNFSGTTFYSGKSDTAEHNCNSAVKNGHYYYTSNGPTTAQGSNTNDGALYVQSYSDSWVGQIAQDYRNGRLFVRGKNNGTWTAWGMLYDDYFKPITATSSANVSLNTYKIPGNYSCESNATSAYFTNQPITAGTAFNLRVERVLNTTSYLRQYYWNHSNYNLWVRISTDSGSTWGSWRNYAQDNNTTYSVVSKTANGLCPQLPNETTTTKFLRQDGTWAVPPFKSVQASKTVTAGTSNVTVTPDSGYDGIASVTVKPTPSQEKTITASRSAQTVTPDSGKLLSKVTVNKYPDASGTYGTITTNGTHDMGTTNNYRYVGVNVAPTAGFEYACVGGAFGGGGMLSIDNATATYISTYCSASYGSFSCGYNASYGVYIQANYAGTYLVCNKVVYAQAGTVLINKTSGYYTLVAIRIA